MLTTTIQQMLDREPFQPFRIVTTSGDRYHVLNPRLVAFGQSFVFYCYPMSDRTAHIRMDQIVTVETLQHA